MKNLFLAASLAAMLLPRAALGEQTQSEANAQAEAGPGIYKPLSTEIVRHVNASHMGETKVIVYKSASKVDNLEVQPYFGIFMEDLHALNNICEEKGWEGSGFASVPFNIRLETWRGAMEKAVIESVPGNFKNHGVNQLGVYQLILKDSQTGRVLYRHKPTVEAKYAPLLNFDGSENSHISGKDTPCTLVRQIVRAPQSRLEPQVIVASDNATTEFEAVTVAHTLVEKLKEELDKIETQEGLRRTENRSAGSSEQYSIDKTTGIFPAMFIGNTSLGYVRQRLNSANTTTREDTRRRYIDLNGMRNLIESSQTYIAHRSYCIRTPENDCSKNPEDLSKMILEALQTERLPVFRSKPPKDDFRQAYILIKDDLAVGEAFSAGMKPAAKTSQSTRMPCESAMKLLEKAVSLGLAAYTGGASKAAELAAEQAAEKSNPPKKGAEGACGNDRDMTISDNNNVDWKFDGKDWVPTSMKVAYVSSANIKRVLNITKERTVSDGGISLGLMEIPLVLLDGQAVRQYNEMDARMKALEKSTKDLRKSARVFALSNTRIWRVYKHRRFDKEYKNKRPFPIDVAITIKGKDVCSVGLYIDGLIIGWSRNVNTSSNDAVCNLYGTVPPGHSYELDALARGVSIYSWKELR